MSRILCLWSGPRNISTAMMRSFGARSDTVCWDEPFFAAFLKDTGLDHPGREETLAQCETDPRAVARRINAPVATSFHFQKHMAHHMRPDYPWDWVADAAHVLLLRHPARVIASYSKGRPEFSTNDLGFSALRDVNEKLAQLTGKTPLVMDSETILTNPEAALRRICEEGFGIDFDPAMLSWDAGPRPEDGPWAPYWYDNVILSTGFTGAPGDVPPVRAEHASIFEDCERDYDALRALI